MDFGFDATLFGPSSKEAIGSWYFVILPYEMANNIREVYKNRKYKGVEVLIHVTIGFVKWQTSMFWSRKLQSYMIPIKKDVRDELMIDTDDKLFVQYDIIDK